MSCVADGAVMIGGRSGITDTTALTDVWAWNGSAWSVGDIATPPGAPQCLGLAGSDLFTYAMIPETPPVAVLRYYALSGSTWTQLATPPAVAETFSDGTGVTTAACSGTSMPPISPDAVMARLGDQVVLVGGSPSRTWTWNGAAWQQLQVAGPPARSYASFAALGDELVLFGGEISDGNLRDDTWIWDGNAWTQVEAPGPSPRMSAAIAAVDDELVLFGGWDPTDNTLDDTWTFDGHTWTLRAAPGPSQRAEALMVPAASATPIL